MKKVLIVLILIVVLAVGGAVMLLSSVNSLLVKAVNTYGPEVMQTSVHLDKVDISILDGKGTLEGLCIGNPEGFSGEYAVRLDTIQAVLDTGTLSDDVVVIQKIEVVAPEIFYERSKGTDNLQTLIQNVRKTTGLENRNTAGQADEKQKSSRVMINELLIRDARVSMLLPGVNKTVGITLPEIRLHDIGKDGRSSFADVAVLVLQNISDAVLKSSITGIEGAETLLRDAETKVGTGLDTVGGRLDGVTNRLTNMFGK